MRHLLAQVVIVLAKELLDVLRDRRTLSRLLLPNLLIGPLMLLAISGFAGSLEERAGRHEAYVAGAEHAPTLVDFLKRRSFAVTAAPVDFGDRLHRQELLAPVVVVPQDFEAKLASGLAVTVELVADGTNDHSIAGLAALGAMLRDFNRERAVLNLAMRGVPAEAIEPVKLHERDLASARARMIKITGVIPFFLMVALFMGAQAAALDSAAGERERGSLEPLLMNPVAPGAIVLGKWAAVALMGSAACLASSMSFIPAQWLIPGGSLQAAFQFTWSDALCFWLLQAPLCAGLSAVLLALAFRSRTYKEAQAATGLAWTCFSLVLIIPLFNAGADAPWHAWVPGLAQSAQMNLLLKGEPIALARVLLGGATCGLLTVLALARVARSMRSLT
jgi:sodium transport system permease protein